MVIAHRMAKTLLWFRRASQMSFILIELASWEYMSETIWLVGQNVQDFCRFHASLQALESKFLGRNWKSA